ncbi:MAG TPA: NADPH-dependent FMN reductase [Actinoplanes sp.]|nr:NADPH-dependent FMN reductase [Actinoplanes sp.]
MTRIMLISGSTDEHSLHSCALRTAAQVAPADLTVDTYDGLRGLPAFVPMSTTAPGTVIWLRHRVEAADAVLFCTPQYAGSLPGSLKNLLDWLIDSGHLDGKPVTWLAVQPPEQDQAALAALQSVLDHGNARVLRSAGVRIPLRPEAVDSDGAIADPQLHLALADVLQSLARSLAAPPPRPQPSWQAYSSVYPMVARRDPASLHPGWPPS